MSPPHAEMMSEPDIPEQRSKPPVKKDRAPEENSARLQRLQNELVRPGNREKLIRLAARSGVPESYQEDMVQDIMMSAFQSLKRFKGKSKLDTWLFRIAFNTCSNYRKTRGRRGRYQGDNRPGGEDSRDEIKNAIDPGTTKDKLTDPVEREELEQMIMKLPEEHRDVLILSLIYGYGPDEVAKMLDINPGTAKSRLHSAKKKLRKRVEIYEKIAA
ncbi:MAG: RNA polymerase sigma factor [Parcubacteria group bacterium]|nr:RNA polymerase sigma factor [Parcubacteria group bacterium]